MGTKRQGRLQMKRGKGFYYLITLITNPLYLWNGIFWKMIILMGLGYGYFSIRKADKILKENPYLASVLRFEKIKTNKVYNESYQYMIRGVTNPV
jgi:hypothetical protein